MGSLNNGEDLLPMQFVRSSISTTYHFSPTDKKPWGWGALCTVNDQTGELSVTSDWGSWSYQWSPNPKHLGSPTLTEFLSNRSSAHYVADKLTSSDDKLRRHFSPEATVKYLCKLAGERYRDNDITKGQCREIVNELREMNRTDDERDFVDAFYRIELHDKVCSEPWECFCHEPTTGYLVLLHSIIPALIESCRRTAAERNAAMAVASDHRAGNTATNEDTP